MTEPEARAILKAIFTAFPNYQSWLKHTDTPNETLDVWSRMLTSVRHDSALKVVDMLIDGTRDMPGKYEEGKLPQFIKSYAARIDQDERTRRATEENARSRLRAAGARKVADYKLPMSKGLAMLWELDNDLRDGKITRDDYDAEKHRIKQLAMEKTELTEPDYQEHT